MVTERSRRWRKTTMLCYMGLCWRSVRIKGSKLCWSRHAEKKGRFISVQTCAALISYILIFFIVVLSHRDLPLPLSKVVPVALSGTWPNMHPFSTRSNKEKMAARINAFCIKTVDTSAPFVRDSVISNGLDVSVCSALSLMFNDVISRLFKEFKMENSAFWSLWVFGRLNTLFTSSCQLQNEACFLLNSERERERKWVKGVKRGHTDATCCNHRNLCTHLLHSQSVGQLNISTTWIITWFYFFL